MNMSSSPTMPLQRPSAPPVINPLAPGDTQMLETALSSPPLLAPVSPVTVPEPLSSASWPSSLPDAAEAHSLSVLYKTFPRVGEELIWRILCRHNSSLADASAQLSTLNDIARSAELLQDAFPVASYDDVVTAISTFAGSLSAAYAHLSNRFISAWDPEHTPARLLASRNMPGSSSPPPPDEFVVTTESQYNAEDNWWAALLRHKRSRLPIDSPFLDEWEHMTTECYSAVEISPRFYHLIYCLGIQRTAPSDYASALSTLRALPVYHYVTSYIIKHNLVACALTVLPILLEEGLINLGAAAWLAIAAESNPELSDYIHPFFCRFPQRSRHVWESRNQFLHNFTSAQKAKDALLSAANGDDQDMPDADTEHQAPSDSAAVSPSASRSALPAPSKGKGRVRSASTTVPYDVLDPQRIIKNPKQDAPVMTKKGKVMKPAAAKGLATRARNKAAALSKSAAILNKARAWHESSPPTDEIESRTVRAIESLRSSKAKAEMAAAMAVISAPSYPVLPGPKFVRASTDSST